MKIAMFTSGYQRNPIEHIFQDAKRFGYDGIELWGGRPHAYPPDLKNGDIYIIKKLIEKYEIPVIGFTPAMNSYPNNMMIGSERMRRESIEYIKLSMDMARMMGAEFTLISPGHAGYYTSYENIWERLILNLKEITNYAESINHKVVLEALTPFESNVITSANELLKALKAVPSPNLVGMCDVVPPFVQEESILAYFYKLGDKMQHMHIVDSDKNSADHILPGEGRLPLSELLKEIKAIDYKGWITIELVTAYMNEPRLYAKRAIENLKNMID